MLVITDELLTGPTWLVVSDFLFFVPETHEEEEYEIEYLYPEENEVFTPYYQEDKIKRSRKFARDWKAKRAGKAGNGGNGSSYDNDGRKGHKQNGRGLEEIYAKKYATIPEYPKQALVPEKPMCQEEYYSLDQAISLAKLHNFVDRANNTENLSDLQEEVARLEKELAIAKAKVEAVKEFVKEIDNNFIALNSINHSKEASICSCISRKTEDALFWIGLNNTF